MRLISGVAVAVVWASSYSSDVTLSLGTSMCCGFSPQKTKKKKKKKVTIWKHAIGFYYVNRVVQLTPPSNSKISSSPQKETLDPLATTAHPASSQPLATTGRLSISLDLPGLDISCKWDHAACGCLCLALGMMFLRFAHVIA